MTVDNCAILHAIMNGYSDEGGCIHPRFHSEKHGEL
jgi:hypothetical protein